LKAFEKIGVENDCNQFLAYVMIKTIEGISGDLGSGIVRNQ